MSDQEITPEPQSRASDTNHNVNGRSLDKPSAPARPTTYPQIHRKSSEPPLRYRKTPLWLLVLYLATLIVPWVLTCILDKRPLTASTYHDQRGRVDVSGYLSFWRVLAFVYALRAISGILTIPVTSVILAHAAVRYAQRCHPDQKLNMRQLFALADRGWADISILWHPKKSGKSSWLLWLGALLVLIGAVQQAVQSAAVSFEPIIATSCADLPFGGCSSNAITIGYDPSLWAMGLVDHNLVVQDVAKRLVTFSNIEFQEYLWVEDPHSDDGMLTWKDPQMRGNLFYYGMKYEVHQGGNPNSTFFVTSLRNGTNTGVLREHALRLNSSVSCEHIPRSKYPLNCPGTKPLDMKIKRPNVNISVCAPGEVGVSPWTLSRNRQDIDEELYIDLQVDPPWLGAFQFLSNYTLHCTSSTTRGYFELGNLMNDFVYGPLLDRWPDPETSKNDFNDYLTISGALMNETDQVPAGKDDPTDLPLFKPMPDPFELGFVPASGPLMTAANALFGNNSFFQLISANSSSMNAEQTLVAICEYGDIPFSQLIHDGDAKYYEIGAECSNMRLAIGDSAEAANPDLEIDRILNSWIRKFETPTEAEYLLDITMYLANEATLRKAIAGTYEFKARPIFTSGGTTFAKPTKTLGATIAISILIFLQVVGLAAMVWYADSVPTWAPTLDAMAVARIGRAMGDGELPPIGPVSEVDRQKLRKVDALVGVASGYHDGEMSSTPGSSTEDERGPAGHLSGPLNGSAVQLGLGAGGLITRDLAPRKLRKRRSTSAA